MSQDLEPKATQERTPEQLVAVIKGFTDFDIFRRCLDDGGLVRVDNPSQPFEANGERFGEIIDQYKGVFDKYEGVDNLLQIPDNFDIELEAKNAFKVAVSILHKSGMIDLEATRGAAQFVGPDSIKVNPEEGTYHHFKATNEFNDWIAENEIQMDQEDGKTVPYPPTKERGKYFVIKIGGESIRVQASNYVADAVESGTHLTMEQALRLSLVDGIRLS